MKESWLAHSSQAVWQFGTGVTVHSGVGAGACAQLHPYLSSTALRGRAACSKKGPASASNCSRVMDACAQRSTAPPSKAQRSAGGDAAKRRHVTEARTAQCTSTAQQGRREGGARGAIYHGFVTALQRLTRAAAVEIMRPFFKACDITLWVCMAHGRAYSSPSPHHVLLVCLMPLMSSVQGGHRDPSKMRMRIGDGQHTWVMPGPAEASHALKKAGRRPWCVSCTPPLPVSLLLLTGKATHALC